MFSAIKQNVFREQRIVLQNIPFNLCDKINAGFCLIKKKFKSNHEIQFFIFVTAYLI
jgi:hypothetical protein